jgi:hypothetical protein
LSSLPSSIGADHGDRGDWILLSGRDPSTFPSRRSTNFAAAAAARSLQQIRAGSDMVIIDKIFIDQLHRIGALDSSRLVFHRQPAARAAQFFFGSDPI